MSRESLCTVYEFIFRAQYALMASLKSQKEIYLYNSQTAWDIVKAVQDIRLFMSLSRCNTWKRTLRARL